MLGSLRRLGAVAVALLSLTVTSGADAAQPGDLCAAWAQCGGGLTCEFPAMQCVEPGDVGAACHATRPCKSTLQCSVLDGFTCQKKKDVSCVEKACPSDKYCNYFSGQCMAVTTPSAFASACSTLYAQPLTELAVATGVAYSFGISASAGAAADVSVELGVAYGPQGQYDCVATYCTGAGLNTDASIGASVFVTYLDSWDQLLGQSKVTNASLSVGIPGIPIDADTGVALSWTDSGEVGSVTLSRGARVGAGPSLFAGLGGSVMAALCTTFSLKGTEVTGIPNIDFGAIYSRDFYPHTTPATVVPASALDTLTGARVRGNPGTTPPQLSALRLFAGYSPSAFVATDSGGRLYDMFVGKDLLVSQLSSGTQNFLAYDALLAKKDDTKDVLEWVIGRNKATGKLDVYRYGDGGLVGPTSIGGGWGTFKTVTGGWNGNVYALKTDGSLMLYRIGKQLYDGGKVIGYDFDDVVPGSKAQQIDSSKGWATCEQLVAGNNGGLLCRDGGALYYSRVEQGPHHFLGYQADWEARKTLASSGWEGVRVLGGLSGEAAKCSSGRGVPYGQWRIFAFTADRRKVLRLPELVGIPAIAQPNQNYSGSVTCPVGPVYAEPGAPSLSGLYRLRTADGYLLKALESGQRLVLAKGTDEASLFRLDRRASRHHLGHYMLGGWVQPENAGSDTPPETRLRHGTSGVSGEFRLTPSGTAGYYYLSSVANNGQDRLRVERNADTGEAWLKYKPADATAPWGTPFEAIEILDPPIQLAAGVSHYTAGNGIFVGAASHFDRGSTQADNSTVVLEGLTQSTAYTYRGAIATVPSEFRPDRRLIFHTSANDRTYRIDVTPEGNVVWEGGKTELSWRSLSGIVYDVKTGSPLTLLPDVVPIGGAFRPGSWTFRDGQVRLSGGLVAQKTTVTEFAQLAAEQRPIGRRAFAITHFDSTGDRPLRIDIQDDGKIVQVGGQRVGAWISLDGMAFVPTAGLPIALNSAHWTHAPGYAVPAAHLVRDRVVLQGAVWPTIISNAAHLAKKPIQNLPGEQLDGVVWPNTTTVSTTIGTLPVGMRPGRVLVFHQVGAEGFPVRVDVKPSGEVAWVASTMAREFVSLDGIEFERGL